MDIKTQKVIDKLVLEGDCLLTCFEDKYLQNSFDQSLLAQAVILLHFGQVNKNGKVMEDDKHEVDLLFLDASKIFEALEKGAFSLTEKVQFLEWYLERWVVFYREKDINRYLEMGNSLVNKINCYLSVSKFQSKQIRKEIDHFEKEKKAYSSCQEISNKMFSFREKGILYTQQYDLLSFLGMSFSLLQNLKTYHISKFTKSFVASVSVKEENKNPILSSQKIEESAVVSHHSLKKELSFYFDSATLKNKFIIEGDLFFKVESLLHQLYSKSKVSFLVRIICANNEQMKQEQYRKARQDLLGEENERLVDILETFLHSSDARDSFYLPCTRLGEKTLQEVNAYLKSYVSLSKKEQLVLYKEYRDLLALVLDELRPYLEYFPFSFVGPIL